jgi:penicillin-binding protein 1C
LKIVSLLAGIAWIGWSGVAQAIPSFNDVQRHYHASYATLLDRDGQVLQTLRIDKTVRRQAWTPYADISPALVHAVIASEDKRFMAHSGVDWQAAGKAAWDNFWGAHTRGASTLSMQLVGLLEEDSVKRGRRSVFGKLTQTAAALRLETRWSKQQILEAYLNLVPFRGELQGVSAMSQHLFGKWPHGLDQRESAIAAALLRSPNATTEVVARRACNLLRELGNLEECDSLPTFVAYKLNGSDPRMDSAAPQLASHLATKLLNTPGQNLRTSLNLDLQKVARQSLRRHLTALRRQNVEDGGVVVIDNASGEVLAWVGSSGDLSSASEVDSVTALRQAGSTLKPFLYATAFETRALTPASLLEDAPLTLDTGNGLYAPQNYEPHYQGWVSVRRALAGSLNVPAVRALVRVGTQPFLDRLHRAGFTNLKQDGEWYGYSLALGSADVSLLMMGNAYRTLANAGQWSALRITPMGQPPLKNLPCQTQGCEQVFSGQTHKVFAATSSFQVADILSDRNARASTFGLESWLTTPYWSAVKTGTSKDMRDNWCAGFSRRYTVAVWVGNASGSPMHDVSGISGAAPIWREVMDWLHRGDPQHARAHVSSRPPSAPEGLIQQTIRFDPASEPPRQEWFIQGTQQSVIRLAQGLRTESPSLTHIVYPAAGTVIALDPDIPPLRQRIALKLSGPAGSAWQWELNGQTLAPAHATHRWLPRPGKHRLRLLDAKRIPVDQVDFEVRALRGKKG